MKKIVIFLVLCLMSISLRAEKECHIQVGDDLVISYDIYYDGGNHNATKIWANLTTESASDEVEVEIFNYAFSESSQKEYKIKLVKVPEENRYTGNLDGEVETISGGRYGYIYYDQKFTLTINGVEVFSTKQQMKSCPNFY